MLLNTLPTPSEPLQSFRRLLVWQKSFDLTIAVYRATASFPKPETYGLASQLRGCAVSATSNIAEGSGRGTDGEMSRFLSIALGSISEMECQLLIATKLGFMGRMLNSFISRLRRAKRRESTLGN